MERIDKTAVVVVTTGKVFHRKSDPTAEGKYGEEVTTLGSVDATGVVYSRKNGAKTKGCRCCVQPRAFRDSTAAMPGRYVTGNNVIKKNCEEVEEHIHESLCNCCVGTDAGIHCYDECGGPN
jgi:hypothetical protein